MRTFFQTLTANLLALFLFFGSLIFFSLLIVLIIIGSFAKQEQSFEAGALLVLDLNAVISDAPPVATLEEMFQNYGGSGGPERLYLWQILESLQEAASDVRISGVLIHGSLVSSHYGSGQAVLSEVRAALQAFRDKGKPVVAYLRQPSIKDYFVASVASQITLDPFGGIDLSGLSSQMAYFGPALKKYGIGVQTTRVGKYKSAVEPFLSAEMSAEAREQLQLFTDQSWESILQAIETSRDVPQQVLQALSNRDAFLLAESALEHGLVDAVDYFDSMMESLIRITEESAYTHSFKQVHIKDYHQEVHSRHHCDKVIAVVYLEGDIVNGEGHVHQAGADRIARQLRALRQNDDIRGIVLRMNSPGGSATASEIIQREVALCQQEMPVVISMGSYSASGAYWIATAGQLIYAEPTTVTGSIGVWGLMFNVAELAQQHGVSFDGVKTGPLADILTLTRPKSEAELAIIQRMTDHIYDAFITRVSEGRNLSIEAVEKIAEGRIWSGSSAQQIGLVDELGGLNQAVLKAAELAGVSRHYHVLQYPAERTLEEVFTSLMTQGEQHTPLTRIARLPSPLRQAMDTIDLSPFNSLSDPYGIYARLPFFIR